MSDKVKRIVAMSLAILPVIALVASLILPYIG